MTEERHLQIEDGLTENERGQLQRFFLTDWRKVAADDDWLLVIHLWQRGYLDRHKSREPLYRLSEEGNSIVIGCDERTSVA